MEEQNGPDFDSIKQINIYGIEFWSARDLMPLLGYDLWQNFEKVFDFYSINERIRRRVFSRVLCRTQSVSRQ